MENNGFALRTPYTYKLAFTIKQPRITDTEI